MTGFQQRGEMVFSARPGMGAVLYSLLCALLAAGAAIALRRDLPLLAAVLLYYLSVVPVSSFLRTRRARVWLSASHSLMGSLLVVLCLFCSSWGLSEGVRPEGVLVLTTIWLVLFGAENLGILALEQVRVFMARRDWTQEGTACPVCGYRIDNLPSQRCPECGYNSAGLGHQPPRKVSVETGRARLAVSLCLIVAGAVLGYAGSPTLRTAGISESTLRWVLLPDKGREHLLPVFVVWSRRVPGKISIPQSIAKCVAGIPDFEDRDPTTTLWVYLISTPGRPPYNGVR